MNWCTMHHWSTVMVFGTRNRRGPSIMRIPHPRIDFWNAVRKVILSTGHSFSLGSSMRVSPMRNFFADSKNYLSQLLRRWLLSEDARLTSSESMGWRSVVWLSPGISSRKVSTALSKLLGTERWGPRKKGARKDFDRNQACPSAVMKPSPQKPDMPASREGWMPQSLHRVPHTAWIFVASADLIVVLNNAVVWYVEPYFWNIFIASGRARKLLDTIKWVYLWSRAKNGSRANRSGNLWHP